MAEILRTKTGGQCPLTITIKATGMGSYIKDDYPRMKDGSEYDGRQLLALVRNGNSPFRDVWDVELLIQEIELNLSTTVLDIPLVSNGANNYGFHLVLLNGANIVARFSRSDVNMPDYDGFPTLAQIAEAEFQAEVYALLRSDPGIMASHLLYHRVPVLHPEPRLERPRDILGRCLLVFQSEEGTNNVWWDLNSEGKKFLLTQAASIRASLFNFNLPLIFATKWLRERLFEQKPDSFPIPISPARELALTLFITKVKATIREIGDMIGWEDDNNTVGPIAFAAKESILRLIPHILPIDEGDAFYRLVLEHGDFGIHNMSIKTDSEAGQQPLVAVTSLYDWETGCIVPAILSDPLMAVEVDLVMDDETGLIGVTRVPEDALPEEREEFGVWADHYFEVLFTHAPNYKRAIHAGCDARHLWYVLRDWRGDDPEEYFGKLGAWAEKRLLHFEQSL